MHKAAQINKQCFTKYSFHAYGYLEKYWFFIWAAFLMKNKKLYETQNPYCNCF